MGGYLAFVSSHPLSIHMLKDCNLLWYSGYIWVEPAVSLSVKHLNVRGLRTVVGLYFVLILGQNLYSHHCQDSHEQQLAYSCAPLALVAGCLSWHFTDRLTSFPTLSPFFT